MENGDNYWKKMRRERKAAGLCIDCRNPSSPGRIRCAACLEVMKRVCATYREKNRNIIAHKERERRERLRKEGKCPRCGAPLIDNEKNYCDACKVGRHIIMAREVLV